MTCVPLPTSPMASSTMSTPPPWHGKCESESNTAQLSGHNDDKENVLLLDFKDRCSSSLLPRQRATRRAAAIQLGGPLLSIHGSLIHRSLKIKLCDTAADVAISLRLIQITATVYVALDL